MARVDRPGAVDRPAGTRGVRRIIHEDRKRFCVVSSEGSSEYYIIRVYSRRTGPDASKLVGLVEDSDGTRRAFRDFKEMVQVLAEAMEGGAIRRVGGDAT